MRNFDLQAHKFKTDHNPGDQISTDPSSMIKNAAGPLSEIISAIPKMVIDTITTLLTDPGQLIDMLLQMPESILGDSLFTGLGNTGLGGLADLGSFIPGLGSGDSILQIAETFITDILNPTQWFGDLLGLFGSPTGLGTGSVVLPVVGDIPILGPLIEEFISMFVGGGSGLSGLSGLESIFTDLLSLFGPVTGLGSGSPSLPGIGSIPILGGLLSGSTFLTSLIPGLDTSKIISGTFPMSIISGLLGLFGGATTSTQAGNFFTNFLSLLGNPTLTGSPGSFNVSTVATNFINTVLNPTGILAKVDDLVSAITGSTGPLSALTDFFGGLVPLDELVATLTGTPGDLTDLASWVEDIPGLSDIVNALTGGSGGFSALTTWAENLTPLNIFNDLLDGLGGGFGNTIPDVINRLEDFLTPTSDIPGGNIIGEIIDDVIPGIGGILNGITSALQGHTVTGATHDDAQTALAAQNAALTGVSATVSRLSTAFTSGVSAYDDFEFTSTGDAGASWSLGYSSGPGHASVDGHNVVWTPGTLTSTTRTVSARWLGTNATSSTDYQHVEVILNSAPQNPLLGSPAANDILLRMDSGGTNFIRIRFRGDNVVIISRVVGGVEVVMNSGSLPTPLVSSATLGGDAGKLGTARYFTAYQNGFPVLKVPEAGTASQVGASYRGWGWGMFAGANSTLIVIPQQSLPGAMKQWTASDMVLA